MPDLIASSPYLRSLFALHQRLGGAALLGVVTLAAALLAAAGTVWAGWLAGATWGPDVVALAALVAAGVAVLLGGLLLRTVHALNASWLQAAALSISDPGTGMLSRRRFMDLAEREWSRCRRYGQDGAMLLMDVDHYRALLQSQGPECVEALMRQAAAVVTQSLRGSDLLSRFHEDQLALFLPTTDPMGALDVAERIRDQVARTALKWQESGVATTVSVGVASVGVAHTSLESLIQDAIVALDSARHAGRNCVRAAPVQPRAQAGRPTLTLKGLPKGNERGR